MNSVHPGFKLGRWNQAYQYDTLRKAEVHTMSRPPCCVDYVSQVGSVTELEPGDLIFVQGTYADPYVKPQRYDIVHVEIFLGNSSQAGAHAGTGEATVGARYKHGTIQVFPSFQFRLQQPALDFSMLPC